MADRRIGEAAEQLGGVGAEVNERRRRHDRNDLARPQRGYKAAQSVVRDRVGNRFFAREVAEIGEGGMRAKNSFEGNIFARTQGRYVVVVLNPAQDGATLLKSAALALR